MNTSTIKAERKIALPTRYPALTMTSALSQVMVTLSQPVSPSVVARILMTQKRRVTSGTLIVPKAEWQGFKWKEFIGRLFRLTQPVGDKVASIGAWDWWRNDS